MIRKSLRLYLLRFELSGLFSDFLIKEAWVPEGLSVGDIIATPVTGAYGHSMGSNYNQMLRPAVVFVSGGSSRLVVARESYEDLIRRDI